MKPLTLFFSALFACIAFSFMGLILTPLLQLGSLETILIDDNRYPPLPSGLAQQGKQTYRQLGCAYCHTQLADQGRRQVVARDYIRQERVLTGTLRVGPDLMNFADRVLNTENRTMEQVKQHLYQLLYDPQRVSLHTNMPPYPFLYQKRKIENTPSLKALQTSDPLPQNYEVIPTPEAEALAAYLLSLTLDYELPEAPFK